MTSLVSAWEEYVSEQACQDHYLSQNVDLLYKMKMSCLA